MPALLAWFFLSFKGRISRQEFWLGYLLMVAVVLLIVPPLRDISLALFRPAGRMGHRDELMAGLAMAMILVSMIMLWPTLALYVKRLHDFDLSGWWLIGIFAALVALEVAGLGPKNGSLMLAAAIGAVPGKRGDNRFGPDPIVPRN